MTKIGLLLPNSTLYPGLSFDIVDGLKAGLTWVNELNTTLFVEGIGFGTDADDLLAKAQKLLMQESVDLVVGMMSRQMAEHLTPLFTAANRLLLVLDVLGDFFGTDAPGPTVFYHSLQSCLASRITGRKAVESGVQQLTQAISFYDAGYLQGYAMTQGVETNGGQMVQYVVSSHVPAQVTLQPLQAALTTGETQAVIALYAGDMAEQFYRLYADLADQVPLWVSPMMLEEQMLETLTIAPEIVRGYVARRPTLFSLLGYEGAAIITAYQHALSARGYPTPATFETLTTLPFTGPRGLIQMDARTHFSSGPQYAATLVRQASGGHQLAGLVADPTAAQDEQQFRTEPVPMTYTGWHNTYLCI